MAGRISEERDGMGDVAVLCPHIPPCDLFALRTPPLGIADGPMLGDVRGRQNGLMRATRKSREPMSGSASTLSPAIHPTMTRRRVAQCRDPTSTPSDSSCSSTAARPADRLPSAMNISRRRIVLASWTPRELETYAAAYSQSVVLCSPRQPFSSLTQPRASWPVVSRCTQCLVTSLCTLPSRVFWIDSPWLSQMLRSRAHAPSIGLELGRETL